MEAADVGIDDGEKPAMDGDEPSPKSARLLPAHGFTRITYVHIHQSDDFSVRLLPAISRRGLGLAAGGF
jgi:cysteamine dioxygenase